MYGVNDGGNMCVHMGPRHINSVARKRVRRLTLPPGSAPMLHSWMAWESYHPGEHLTLHTVTPMARILIIGIESQLLCWLPSS